jgi:F0F1-type ATP synthase alpha subunit
MTKKKVLSIYERKKGLTKLIESAKKMHFNTSLIEKYEKELNEVQEEIKKDKKYFFVLSDDYNKAEIKGGFK